MSDFKDSIWEQNEQGNWNLYFNTDQENPQQSIMKESDILKSKKSTVVLPDVLVLGTLIMTPDGIGRLIKLDQEYGYIKHKQDSPEKKYPIKDLSSSFNCFITIFSKEGNEEIVRIRIKPQGKVEDIFEQLEKFKKINRGDCTYNLICNGMKLKNDFNFDQIDLKNNSKMLLSVERNIQYSISRFKNVNLYWYTNVSDGITFTVSKPIRLIGVGIYGSHEGKTLQSECKVLDGDSNNSPSIYEESITVPPAPNKTMAVMPIHFAKAVKINAEQKYSVTLNTKTSCNSYYGVQGKAVVEGEKGVIFRFFRIQGRNGGTSVENGNIPEFYYYI